MNVKILLICNIARGNILILEVIPRPINISSEGYRTKSVAILVPKIGKCTRLLHLQVVRRFPSPFI